MVFMRLIGMVRAHKGLFIALTVQRYAARVRAKFPTRKTFRLKRRSVRDMHIMSLVEGHLTRRSFDGRWKEGGILKGRMWVDWGGRRRCFYRRTAHWGAMDSCRSLTSTAVTMILRSAHGGSGAAGAGSLGTAGRDGGAFLGRPEDALGISTG